jgi:hypothetical protein
METFTLFVWLYIGMRVEDRYIPNLSETECMARRVQLLDTVGARTKCVKSGYPVPPSDSYQCADCSLTPIGRKPA